MAKEGIGLGCNRCATSKLPTHYFGIGHVPVIITHCPPNIFVEDLYTTLAATVAIYHTNGWRNCKRRNTRMRYCNFRLEILFFVDYIADGAQCSILKTHTHTFNFYTSNRMLPLVWVVIVVVVVVVTVVVVLGDMVTETFCVVVGEDRKNTITWYMNTPDNPFMMAGLGYGTHAPLCFVALWCSMYMINRGRMAHPVGHISKCTFCSYY